MDDCRNGEGGIGTEYGIPARAAGFKDQAAVFGLCLYALRLAVHPHRLVMGVALQMAVHRDAHRHGAVFDFHRLPVLADADLIHRQQAVQFFFQLRLLFKQALRLHDAGVQLHTLRNRFGQGDGNAGIFIGQFRDVFAAGILPVIRGFPGG